MDDFEHLCPVCINKGKTTFLQLRQINLTTAVYICKDLKCSYPEGHSWIYKERNFFDNLETYTDSSEDEDDSQSVTSLQNFNSNNVNKNEVCDKVKKELEMNIETPTNKLDSQITHVVDDLGGIFKPLDLPGNENISNSQFEPIPERKFEINMSQLNLQKAPKVLINLKNMKLQKPIQSLLNDSQTNPQPKFENQISQLNLNKEKILVFDSKNKKIQQASPEMISKMNFIIPPNQPTAVKNLKDLNMKIIPVKSTCVENKIEEKQEKLVEINKTIHSKLKVKLKKEQSSASLPDSVIKAAELLLKEEKPKPILRSKSNKNFINAIFGKNESTSELQKTASRFEGFKCSTKVIKSEVPAVKVNKRIKKEIEVTDRKEIEEKTNEINQKTENNEIDLNDFFDSIGNLEMTNVPENDANIADVDEWLTALCQ